MFINFEKSYLQMTRGDTFIFPLVINSGTELNFEKYTLEDNEYLYVAIMEPNQSFEDAIIRKRYTNKSDKDKDGNILFILDSIDTEYLLTGKYYITVKLRSIIDNKEIVKTLLPLKEFWITGTDKTYNLDNSKVINNGQNEKVIIYDGGTI